MVISVVVNVTLTMMQRGLRVVIVYMYFFRGQTVIENPQISI
jgi:hypothetical protein